MFSHFLFQLYMKFVHSTNTIVICISYHLYYAFVYEKGPESGPYFFGTNTVILSGITLISEF